MTYNRLLDALSAESYERLRPHLIPIHLTQGTSLHLPGDNIKYLYFPIDCLLSIITIMEDGATMESGIVGNQDVLGVSAFMSGSLPIRTEHVVQIAGTALKIDAEIFRRIFIQDQLLRQFFLKYTQAFIAQISQTSACNRLHSLEQRLCRWLLEAQARTESDHIELTQQFLAQMLGVRRAGVTQAAQKLQDNGLISYSRGHINVCDRPGLEANACECYRIVQEEYERLLFKK
ncbi:Crp/Fnr family transcriptional regulator [Halomicronema hongdechloris C2206]|uniref:Crp/Fnr family transcriptional regulator n=1 Tax=Halomicronema hongdechloris C2206 TaxID=1641165 RepID=A0A1Z3HUX5_9CYAN|nr:Crp/Fnr family transcriptional regulator [Halomicronema hongdechloris]ASC74121.1 Crp/Fnr family transcriptional regulator [Halomicronema hongdechloris C2206]